MRSPAFIKQVFGGPHTPVCAGTTRRFDPYTGAEIFVFDVPVTGFPSTYAQNSPREASPTGKSGVGYVTHNVPPQPVASVRSNYFNMDTTPIYAGDTPLITQGLVNPWDSINSKAKVKRGFDVPGAKWGW